MTLLMKKTGEKADLCARIAGAKEAAEKIGLTGLITFRKKLAVVDLEAPNYGEASSPNTNCSNCSAYKKEDKETGFCEKYDFLARADYTCDGWENKSQRSPSTFIRTKLR